MLSHLIKHGAIGQGKGQPNLHIHAQQRQTMPHALDGRFNALADAFPCRAIILQQPGKHLPLSACPNGVAIHESRQLGRKRVWAIAKARQHRQGQCRVPARARVGGHLRHFQDRHGLCAQRGHLAIGYHPVGCAAVPDGMDALLSVLEFDFLFFVIKQAAIHPWILAHVARVDHAPEVGFEQRFLCPLECEFARIVGNHLRIAERDGDDPPIGEGPPDGVEPRTIRQHPVALMLFLVWAGDVDNFLAVGF